MEKKLHEFAQGMAELVASMERFSASADGKSRGKAISKFLLTLFSLKQLCDEIESMQNVPAEAVESARKVKSMIEELTGAYARALSKAVSEIDDRELSDMAQELLGRPLS